MSVVKQTSDLRHLLYPRCPYNNSIIILFLRISIMCFGTIGLIFLNVWIAGLYLLYSLAFNILAWPIKHCQHCYYKIRESIVEENTSTSRSNLLPLKEWKGLYLERHIACGKKWGKNLFILWLGPIALIVFSFLVEFSIVALISLVGFIGALIATGIYMRWKVCPTC
ncbi:MAG: hypothetical protein ACFFDC_14580, partial [Promethearchaeota archaeon]